MEDCGGASHIPLPLHTCYEGLVFLTSHCVWGHCPWFLYQLYLARDLTPSSELQLAAGSQLAGLAHISPSLPSMLELCLDPMASVDLQDRQLGSHQIPNPMYCYCTLLPALTRWCHLYQICFKFFPNRLDVIDCF